MTAKTTSSIRLLGGIPWRSVAVVLAISLLLASASLMAQERSGNIAGVVKDQSGGVLPGVTVTLTNKASNRIVTTKTDSAGTYIARELEPGRYTVKFELTGFSNAVIQDVILLLGKTIDVNTTMQVGAVEQIVEVTSGATLIDTISTAVAHNVTAEEFDRMPKARSFQDVALTSPSVNSGRIEGGIQVNGASAAENNFTIDGLSVTGVLNGDSRQDAVFEFLQEVQVKTSGIEAEYGGALGGVISAVTKSGGNEFHGEAHWYNYGSNLNAGPTRRLQTDPVGQLNTTYFQDSKIKDHFNEVGGSLGGPFLRNKLYFYTSITPLWRRQAADVKLKDGPSAYESKRNSINMFNKLSWDPLSRVRTNFSWLYTTQKRTGLIPSFNGYCADCNLNPASTYASFRTQGWYLPKSSYTGSADITLSSNSLLSFRGGYFWDNFKDQNTPVKHQTRYNATGIGLPFEIPAALRQPNGYFDVPLTTVSYFDVTSRGFYMADYGKTFRFGGTHNLKTGTGFQKMVNTVSTGYQGGGYNVAIFWDRTFRSVATGTSDRGQYGYYRVRSIGTLGSASSGIAHMYIQDQWQVHPRVSLSLGLRTERETIPSFSRAIKDIAIKFGWGDKLAPRLGGSVDLFGNGKTKVFGSWGRLFDWTKFELVRGSFGGDIWQERWYSLDTLDIFSLSLNNLQGRNLWSSAPGSFQDYRIPAFDEDSVDPNLKPMFVDNMVVGVEHQLTPHLVVSAHYVRNRLNRTIEDIGRLVDGSEVYTIGNPGEGRFVNQTNHYTTTPDYPMPRPDRRYDALELSLNRRFSSGWFLGGNYTFSRLYGNYAGLSSTDEIVNGALPNQSWNVDQSPFTALARPGGNANRDYDSDDIQFDSRGNLLLGRLETDRPHVFKVYGSYTTKWGSEVGGRFYGGSGTPITTRVENSHQTPIFVNGRGDAGRLPFLNTTDLLVSHEFRVSEGKRLRLEFNAINLFNQKTARYMQNVVTRYRESGSQIVLDDVNLLKGYDWRALLAQTNYAKDPVRTTDRNSLDPAKNFAVDPTYGKYSFFNSGFEGRFMIKFIF